MDICLSQLYNTWILLGLSLSFIIHVYLPLGNSSDRAPWVSKIHGQVVTILSKARESIRFFTGLDLICHILSSFLVFQVFSRILLVLIFYPSKKKLKNSSSTNLNLFLPYCTFHLVQFTVLDEECLRVNGMFAF